VNKPSVTMIRASLVQPIFSSYSSIVDEVRSLG